MNRRTSAGIVIALFGFSLVAGGFFMINQIFRNTLAPVQQPTPQPVPKETVVVAARDVAIGDLLTEPDLATVDVPVELVPRNAIMDVAAVVNRISKVPMISGEMVLSHHLADPTNINHDMAFVIGDSQVIIAFPASDLMSTLSILERGDFVDLFASVTVSPGQEEGQAAGGEEEEPAEPELFTFDAMARLELSAMVVDVISEPSQENQGDEEIPAKTQTRAYLLAMPPQEALLLKHLIDMGARFDMVLRSPTSKELADLTPIMRQYVIDRYELQMER